MTKPQIAYWGIVVAGVISFILVLVDSSPFTLRDAAGQGSLLLLYLLVLWWNEYPRDKFQSIFFGSAFGYAILKIVGPLLEQLLKSSSPVVGFNQISAIPFWLRVTTWLLSGLLVAAIDH
jgi:hypothetical protein